jgi:hypothetical protein
MQPMAGQATAERREPVMAVVMKAYGPRSLAWRVAAALTVAVPAALLGGCSAALDPTYPAIHDMPAPRSDTPMTAEEIKRATADLVTERNTLNAEAQTTPDNAATGSTPPAAANASKPKPTASAKTQTSGARPNP